MAGIKWYAGYPLNQKSCMTKPVPLCSLTNLQLRFLCPTDLDEVRTLCQDWFPIDYPYSWYEDITSNPRFYSLAAVYDGIIIGLIVAEIKSYFKLNRELTVVELDLMELSLSHVLAVIIDAGRQLVNSHAHIKCRTVVADKLIEHMAAFKVARTFDKDRGILAQSFGKQTEVGYILSLGVSKAHRRNGIASLLLDNLISHLTTLEHSDCKAIFLHVLTTNSAAIHFYEHRNFRLHSFLPYYYSIKGKCKDGFTYVLYINGGHPPWGIYDYMKHYCSIVYRSNPCSFPVWLWHKMQAALQRVWPGLRRVVVQNTAAVFSFYS